MSLSVKTQISVGARHSALSCAQVAEVLQEIKRFHPDIDFVPVWKTTTGDLDLTTSLRTLEKTNFFTKEIDEAQLKKEFRIAIHSAKDLPDPLCPGLSIVAITKGVDCSDSIVVREEEIPIHGRIGTSSPRREQNILSFRSDLICVDIRGTIEKRLEQLDAGFYDGVVIAEAALIRLGLTHRKRIKLPGESAALQGQLAVIACEDDEEMKQLFRSIDTR